MRGSVEDEPDRNGHAGFVRLGFGRRAWIAAIVIAASGLVASSPGAAYAQAANPVAELHFDIPSQPLASALKSYSAVTQLELFYESSLVDGRRSSPLHGPFSRDTALRQLLEGSGVSAASFEPGTFTLLPARPAKGQDLAAAKSKAAEFSPYFARIQAGLRAAFCGAPALQTDTAELLVRLWIAPSGAVASAELLSPTGSDDRDRAYAAVLRDLVIGAPPPRGMPQPVTLMVLPRTSPAAAECPQLGGTSSVRASAP